MNKQIVYKYPINWGTTDINLPDDAEILTFQIQGYKPYIWVKLDPTSPTIVRRFTIYGTGHEIANPEDLWYIGTVQSGSLVWHLFEIFIFEAPGPRVDLQIIWNQKDLPDLNLKNITKVDAVKILDDLRVAGILGWDSHIKDL